MAALRRRAGRSSAVLALAALVLGACVAGGGGDDDDSEAVEGTMRLALAGDIVFDPVDASLASASDLMVLDLLHDGLTALDGDGRPVPSLARGWEANEDLTAWRFRIDPSATFTDGRAITARDAVLSIERVIAGGDASLAALSLELVTGFQAFVDGEAPHVSGLSAPDSDTVRIALDSPLSVLPEVLASPTLGVVDIESVEAGDLGDLVLSGDWVVEDAGEESVTVERRPGIDGPLGTVALRGYDDANDAYVAFRDGDADWAPIPPDRFEEAMERPEETVLAPFHAELFFGMNVADPTLSNPIVRAAISQAIDRETLVEEVYADLAQPLGTIVPQGVVGHGEADERCRSCSYDPETARSIVETAFPDGNAPVVGIDFDESPNQQAMAELIAGDLEAAGFRTKLRPLPLEEYKRYVVSGEQDLFSFGWIGAYTSPDAYLAPLFGSSANDNLTSYQNPEVDVRLEAARAGSDRGKALQRWGKAEQIVLDDWVVVPIAQFRTQVVVADGVEGFRHRVDGTVDWSNVSRSG